MIEVLIALFGGMALLCKAAFGWIEPIRRENRQQKEEEERWKRLFDAECEYYAQYGGIENHSKALVATELDWEMIHITNLEDYLKPDLIAIFGEENWKEIVERDEWWISEEKKEPLKPVLETLALSKIGKLRTELNKCCFDIPSTNKQIPASCYTGYKSLSPDQYLYWRDTRRKYAQMIEDNLHNAGHTELYLDWYGRFLWGHEFTPGYGWHRPWEPSSFSYKGIFKQNDTMMIGGYKLSFLDADKYKEYKETRLRSIPQ